MFGSSSLYLDHARDQVRVPRDDGTVVWQDLDSATDATWQNLSTAIFPKVAVEVEQGLADYKAAASKVDRLKEGCVASGVEALANARPVTRQRFKSAPRSSAALSPLYQSFASA